MPQIGRAGLAGYRLAATAAIDLRGSHFDQFEQGAFEARGINKLLKIGHGLVALRGGFEGIEPLFHLLVSEEPRKPSIALS